MQENKPASQEIKELKEQLLSVEQRLARIEKSLEHLKGGQIQFAAPEHEKPAQNFEINFPGKPKGSIEFNIGEYGMAWLGNIVLLIGIVFFVQLIHNNGNPLISVLLGYASVAGFYAVAFYSRKFYPYLSNLFRYSGHLLLFYITLRLHFAEHPVIQKLAFGLLALIIVLSALFYLSLQKQSPLLTGIVLLMSLTVGIMSNSTHFLLGITAITAVASVVLYYRFGWIKFVIFYILFVYLVQLIWLLNNPFVTGQAYFRDSHEYYFIYLIFTGFVFSLPAILPRKSKISDDVLIFTLIWNGLGFTALLIITVFTYLISNYAFVFGLISFFSLFYSIIIHSKSSLKIAASLYAIYGFMAMSVSIYGIFLIPKSYMLFALQSFIVVSMALWFRSRFIVVANTFLFLVLLIFYIAGPVHYNSTNFTFLLVAFITARVINWKKNRLNLKTEMLRNLYLIAGLAMTLIAFHYAVPESFTTVSWIFAAVLFFLLGYLLKNIKYRWLAISTLVASAVHLVFVDMSNMEMAARILVFLFLAIISITVSILYTRHLVKKKEDVEN